MAPGISRWLWRVLAVVALFITADLLLPPDMTRVNQVSTVVAARDGTPLRTYLTADGMVRQPVAASAVDPGYRALLIAYEDRRFGYHPGVDPLALARAVGQAIRAGRVVSGGSTLTMQVARLLEPRPRTFRSKLIEIVRAFQLERRYSKQEILGFYFTLAPMGGNLEGVAAASRSYFGKEPARLTPGEAAVLVALPQAPTRLRQAASAPALTAARNKVLRIAGPRAGLDPLAVSQAMAEPARLRLRPLGLAAPHLADRLRRLNPAAPFIQTSIDAPLQRVLERRAKAWQGTLDAQGSLAILVADKDSGEVRAYIGSSDFRSAARAGQVDAITAVRSPGSTLKPLIYAFAFDRGLAHPLSLVDDVETRFGSYQPANFEDQYHGQVTVADALRLSLNVPAVMMLDRVGPVFFTQRLARAGIAVRLPAGVRPGLPLALGGAGVTLEDLVMAYRALATDGVIHRLRFAPDAGAAAGGEPLVGDQALAWVAAILRSAPRPDGTPGLAAGEAGPVAIKTGTSYGFRDAWALGFDGRHVIGVWTGRPDGSPSPGRFGVNTAAPILLELFGLVGIRSAGPAADLLPTAALPPHLVRLAARPEADTDRLTLLFPIDQSSLPLVPGRPVPLEARGGSRPYVWLVNGAPLAESPTGTAVMWTPDGVGFHAITLIDGDGRSRSARVRLVAGMAIAR